MQWLKGKEVRDAMMPGLCAEAKRLAMRGSRPRLVMVLVGEHAPSRSYVRSKAKLAEQLGIQAEVLELREQASQAEMHALLDGLNANESVHGILCQSPLPAQLDETQISQRIHPKKDVDGFHPHNAGMMLLGKPCLAPCTPSGVLSMLHHYGIATRGRTAVVLGRSQIVGRPMAVMLSAKGEDAIVTLLHSAAEDLRPFTQQAEIVVVAVGKPGLITAEMIRPGAVVIDVGITRVESADSQRGYRIVGDVDAASVAQKAGALSPVPGGVGLMTVTMLMANTLRAARWQQEDVPPDAILGGTWQTEAVGAAGSA